MDYLFVLIFATAVIKRAVEWDFAFRDLLPYAAPGMVVLCRRTDADRCHSRPL